MFESVAFVTLNFTVLHGLVIVERVQLHRLVCRCPILVLWHQKVKVKVMISYSVVNRLLFYAN